VRLLRMRLDHADDGTALLQPLPKQDIAHAQQPGLAQVLHGCRSATKSVLQVPCCAGLPSRIEQRRNVFPQAPAA